MVRPGKRLPFWAWRLFAHRELHGRTFSRTGHTVRVAATQVPASFSAQESSSSPSHLPLCLLKAYCGQSCFGSLSLEGDAFPGPSAVLPVALQDACQACRCTGFLSRVWLGTRNCVTSSLGFPLAFLQFFSQASGFFPNDHRDHFSACAHTYGLVYCEHTRLNAYM